MSGVRRWRGGGADGDGEDLPIIRAEVGSLGCPSLAPTTQNGANKRALKPPSTKLVPDAVVSSCPHSTAS